MPRLFYILKEILEIFPEKLKEMRAVWLGLFTRKSGSDKNSTQNSSAAGISAILQRIRRIWIFCQPVRPVLRKWMLWIFIFAQSFYIGDSFLLFFAKDAANLGLSVEMLRDFFVLFSLVFSYILFATRRISNEKKIFLLMSSYLFALALLFAIPLDSAAAIPEVFARPRTIFFAAFLFQFLSLRLFALKSDELSSFSLFFLPPFLIYMVYFLAFYPAVMSRDSLVQWEQITAFQFEDWHPFFHTLSQWLLTRFWFSPAIVALTQMAFLALVIALSMHYLRKKGVSTAFLFIIALFYGLHPVIASYSVTLWKDVPFSIAVFWLSYLAIRIVHSRGQWLFVWKNRILLSLSLWLSFFFRHNGIAPVSGFLIGLILFYAYPWGRFRWQRIRSVIIVVLLFLSFVYLVKKPLWKSFAVEGGFPGINYGITHQIAAVVYHGGELTDKEWEFLKNVLPRSYWKRLYDPYQSGDLLYLKAIPFIKAKQKEYFKVWYGIFQRYPKIMAQHIVQSASLIWRISYPEKSYFYVFCFSAPPKKYRGMANSKFPSLRNDLKAMYRSLTGAKYNWAVTRPALYLYITFFFGLLIWVRYIDVRFLLPLFPLLANTGAIFFTLPVQDTRYMFPVFLIMPLIIAYFFAKDWQKSGE